MNGSVLTSDSPPDGADRHATLFLVPMGLCVYYVFHIVLLGITAPLELETQAFCFSFDNICKSVYVTNKTRFDLCVFLGVCVCLFCLSYLGTLILM